MDPLSVTASIIAVITLTGSVISFLNDAEDAPKDRARCQEEVSNLQCLLIRLKNRVEDVGSDDPWFVEVRLLAEKGLFDQIKAAMQQLKAKLQPGSRFKKVRETLLWKLTKTEVTEILSQIERQKSLIHIALEMDHK